MPHFPEWFVVICVLLPILNALQVSRKNGYNSTIGCTPHIALAAALGRGAGAGFCRNRIPFRFAPWYNILTA